MLLSLSQSHPQTRHVSFSSWSKLRLVVCQHFVLVVGGEDEVDHDRQYYNLRHAMLLSLSQSHPQTRHVSFSSWLKLRLVVCQHLWANIRCIYTVMLALGSVSNTVTTSSSSSVLYWRFFQSWFVLFTLYILDISYLKSPSCVPAQHYVSVTSCHCHLTVTSSDTP